MSTDAATWAVGALEVATALTIAAFWVVWFRQEHAQPWLPEGYVSHERAFVWADGLLAVVLVTAAGLQVSGRAIGDSLGLIASGMLGFLGVLDAAYFAREGMFRRERDGLLNGALVVGVLTVSVVLAVRFA